MTQAFNLSQFANKVNSSGQADLATAVTGTLSIANGGTNNGSLGVTAGGVLYTDGSKVANVGAGTSGQVLKSNGSSAPSWGSAGAISWQSVQTTSFTAVTGNGYPINTTSSTITVTLPASPVAGDSVTFTDYAGTWATNNVTINLNGKKLDGSSVNATLSTNRQSISFVYIDSTQGWISYSGFLDSIPIQTYSASYLIVAGGGAGGAGAVNGGSGGGGAGGLLSGTTNLTTGTTYSFVVGAGSASSGSGGNNSTGLSLTAIGGGAGGAYNGVSSPTSGGSGGGGAENQTGASGTAGQGYAGGTGISDSAGAGGGGAGAVGTTIIKVNNKPIPGDGGIGVASSITGSSTYYAGGGAGSYYSLNTPTAIPTGGLGGGGNGSCNLNSNTSTAGTANTGGGGGGRNGGGTGSVSGGSGIIIISVATANYTGITTGSPTVTTNGSNTVIKFTSSGSYTA